MKTATRRQAREAALQMLYAWDVGKCGADEAISGQLRLAEPDQTLPAEARTFAERLVRGTIANQAELDRLIQRHAEHWRLSRMAPIDRLILRLAAYELVHEADTPAAVAINEAIELARRYSEAEASGFVNGILDAIHRAGGGTPGPGEGT